MNRFAVTALLLSVMFGFSSECRGSIEDFLKVPKKWKVVKETPHYLIVEMVDDISYEQKGKNGTYEVNYEAGQRRVFLKGRTYRSVLESNQDYIIEHKIEIELHLEDSTSNESGV